MHDFSGSLDLSGSGGRMVLSPPVVPCSARASSRIRSRREDVSGINVDPNNGQGKVNVDGVTVTFSFFGS